MPHSSIELEFDMTAGRKAVVGNFISSDLQMKTDISELFASSFLKNIDVPIKRGRFGLGYK